MLKTSDILDEKDKHLRAKNTDVEFPLKEETKKLINDMLEHLYYSQIEEYSEKYDLRPGVGLAAVQVGQLKRMCAIYIPNVDSEGNVKNIDQWVLVNPKVISYTEKEAYLRHGEGCLSVPEDKSGLVPRHAKITLKAYDALTKKDVKIVARGFTAICIQHEMDHFDGVLYYDHFNKENPTAPIPNAMVIE